MRYVLDKSSGSMYIQLFRMLKEDIEKGVYRDGDKLPSKRIMALDSGASVITVQHAYDLLADEGYIETRERSGYFVIYKHGSSAESGALPLKAAASHYTDTAFPFSIYSKAVRKVLTEYGDRIIEKSPNFGTPEIRLALCDYLRRSRGIDVSPNQIVIGAGAEYIYTLILRMFPGDTVFGIEYPCYEKIQRIYEEASVPLDHLRMGHDGILSEELARTPAEVIHLTPYNSVPSKVTASGPKRREYITWLNGSQSRFIIEDDYDSEFSSTTKSESTLFSMDTNGSVIYVNTFTRTLFPGLRIGYMILPEKLLPRYTEKNGFLSCTVPMLSQFCIAELLMSGEFQRHINRVRRSKSKKY